MHIYAYYTKYTEIEISNISSTTSTLYVYIRLIYSINHPGKTTTRSRNSITCELHHSSPTVTPWFFWLFLTNSWTKQFENFRFLGHFSPLRPAGRLCVHTKDLPRAMRPKLVVILSSRPIFRLIFAWETPTRPCDRERILTIRDLRTWFFNSDS